MDHSIDDVNMPEDDNSEKQVVAGLPDPKVKIRKMKGFVRQQGGSPVRI